MVEINVGKVVGPAWSGGPQLVERQEALENTVGLVTAVQEAYRKWDSTWKYNAYDPTFYNGIPYYANPLSVPDVGQSPISHPEKWNSPQGETDISQAMALIGDNAAKIATLWANAFGGLSSNPFILTFEDIDDIALESGVWNEALNRLEC
jgi:type II secretory pathway pseudopilin PulG